MYTRKFPFDLNRIHTFDLNINYQQHQDFHNDPVPQAPFGPVAMPLANWPPIHGGVFAHPPLHHCQHNRPEQAQLPLPPQQLHEPTPYMNPMATDGLWQPHGSKNSSLLCNWQDMILQGTTMLVSQEGQQHKPVMETTTTVKIEYHPQKPYLAPRFVHPSNALTTATPTTIIGNQPTKAERSEPPRSPAHTLDLSSALAIPIITDEQIGSPDWLPDGWITELHIRQTGTTAGTRDKYYKHLLSGRRFRSRNEVLRFLKTGKGRVRKRYRGKKLICDVAAAALASSCAGPGILRLCNDNLSPRKAGAAASVTSSDEDLDNPRLANDDPSPSKQLVVADAAVSVSYDGLSPCKGSNILMAATTTKQPAIMIGLKRLTTQGSPQKSPSKKKPRTVSPKETVDKQASRLWQWLQKPASKSSDPQISKKPDLPQEIKRLDFNTKSICKELPQQSNREIIEGLERGLLATQRTVELGREIQAAERTVTFLTREMLATVKNLAHEIREGQNTIGSRNHTACFDELKSEAEKEAVMRSNDALSNISQAAQMINAAMDNVLQAAGRIDVTMGTIIQSSQKLNIAIGNMIQASKIQYSTNIINTDLIPHIEENGIDRIQRSDITLNLMTEQSQQPNRFQEAQEPDLINSNFYQATKMLDTSSICRATQASLGPIFAMGQVSQTALMPVLKVDKMVNHIQMKHVLPLTPAVCIPTIYVNQMSNLISSASSSTLVNKKDTAEMTSGKSASAIQISAKENNQIVTAEPRGSTLSFMTPKLDLTRICMNITRRQRAKIVQTMKTRHTRGLLAAVGRRLCYVALERETCLMVPNGRPYSLANLKKGNLLKQSESNTIVDWAQETALYLEPHDMSKETDPESDQLTESEDTTEDEMEDIQNIGPGSCAHTISN